VVWKEEGILLDGHNRYRICQSIGAEFKTIELSFEDRDGAKEWMIKNQLGRRNLVLFQRCTLVEHLEEIEANRARARMLAGVANPVENLPQGKTRDIMGGHAEVSGKTWDMFKAIQKKADDDTKQALRDGDISINAAYTKLKREEKKAEFAKKIEEQRENIKAGLTAPTGEYDVIVIDPPWPYGTEYDPDGRRAANPYPEMSLDEITNIKLPAAENCILFLWTTHKFMRHSFSLLDAWGFRDVSIITWVKDRMGLGQWLRSQSEFCIMAVKGKPIVDLKNQTTVVNGPLQKHSQKPDEFYDLVDSLCIGQKLDYFARETRQGWAVFGSAFGGGEPIGLEQ
jgi:N6-adenosine-specific RNA methylase IME4